MLILYSCPLARVALPKVSSANQDLPAVLQITTTDRTSRSRPEHIGDIALLASYHDWAPTSPRPDYLCLMNLESHAPHHTPILKPP
jgi:hypothetical protein